MFVKCLWRHKLWIATIQIHTHLWMYNPSCHLFYRCELSSAWDHKLTPSICFQQVCVHMMMCRTIHASSIPFSVLVSKQKQFNNFETQFIFFMIEIRYKYNFQNVRPVRIQITFTFCHTRSLCRLNHICLNSFYTHIYVCNEIFSMFVWFGIQYECEYMPNVSVYFFYVSRIAYHCWHHLLVQVYIWMLTTDSLGLWWFCNGWHEHNQNEGKTKHREFKHTQTQRKSLQICYQIQKQIEYKKLTSNWIFCIFRAMFTFYCVLRICFVKRETTAHVWLYVCSFFSSCFFSSFIANYGYLLSVRRIWIRVVVTRNATIWITVAAIAKKLHSDRSREWK